VITAVLPRKSNGRFIALTEQISGTYTRRILGSGSTMPKNRT